MNDILEMIVEIPKGSTNKYEYDFINQKWSLDRVLSGAMFYPEEYGYLPETLDYDGDPLDVVCLTNQSTFPGCHLPIRIIGVLKMIDGGEEDDKLIAVNAVDPRFKDVKQLADIGSGKLAEISNFFARYKELENKEVLIKGYGDIHDAQEILVDCQRLYKKHWNDLITKKISKKELVKVLNS